jgi:hypothetical protein
VDTKDVISNSLVKGVIKQVGNRPCLLWAAMGVLISTGESFPLFF